MPSTWKSLSKNHEPSLLSSLVSGMCSADAKLTEVKGLVNKQNFGGLGHDTQRSQATLALFGQRLLYTACVSWAAALTTGHDSQTSGVPVTISVSTSSYVRSQANYIIRFT